MDIIQGIIEGASKGLADLHDQIGRGLSSPNVEYDEPKGFQTEGILFGEIPPKTKTSDQLRAGFGWVYACISAISDAVARAQLRLYKIDKDSEIEEVLDHPLLELLWRVNDFTSQYDHFSLTQQYLDLTGEAPWFVDRGESGMEDPKTILLLRPDRLTIKQSKDKNAKSPIEKYVYKLDFGGEIDIKPEELVFLRYPDPANSFRGKGTLAAAARTVDIDEFSEEFNKRFFYNSARPDSVLQSDQKLSAQQRESLRSSIKKLYQGLDKAHKTLILESGLEWKPMALTQKDMDFMKQQEHTARKILALFRVPKAILGMAEDVNLANAKIGEYVFAKWTVKPKLERVVAQLNEFFLPMFKNSQGLFLSFDDPVSQDMSANITKYDSALGKGWMTINEIRAEQNLEDVGEDGDIIYVPNAIVPLDMAGQVQPSLPIRGVKEIKTAHKKMTKFVRYGIIARSGGGYANALRIMAGQAKAKAQTEKAKDEIKKIEGKIDSMALDMIKGIVVARRQNQAKAASERQERHVQFGRLFVKAADEFEKAMNLTLRVMFQNQMEKVVRKFPAKAIDIDEYLLDEEDEAEVMVRVLQPQLRRIIDDQGRRASQLVGTGLNFNMATARVRRYLMDRTYKFSFEVSEETNRLLGTTLAEGVKAGEGIPQLTKRVRGLFDDFEKYRAERISRSEVIRASNFAANEAYEQSGVVDKVEWLTTEDERTCEWCVPMDGKTIALGDNFFDKGDKFTGQEGGKLDLSYGSVEFPPLHVNCRCTIVPIVK